MGFKDKLKKKLKGSLTEVELSALPRGFQTVGKVIILKLNSILIKKKEIIGKACLELFPNIRSIYINLGRIVGTFREPENIEYLAGEDNPIVEHREHGIIYKFDITKIMFSKGNVNERKYLATLIKDGEIIVDMFAGIGYFSLPIATHALPEKIYSIEINPVSYNFLLENIRINHLEDIIFPISGNSKEEVLNLSKSGIKADRVIMGVFPAPKEFIKEALSLTKDNGTIFHYEGVVGKDKYDSLFKEFNEEAKKVSFKSELKQHRIIKSYGPNLYHTVLDILAYKE
ncbi:MAG: class I SAM-dependent methyltransferase family protein [Candidatus Hodarchaeota archaeon]